MEGVITYGDSLSCSESLGTRRASGLTTSHKEDVDMDGEDDKRRNKDCNQRCKDVEQPNDGKLHRED